MNKNYVLIQRICDSILRFKTLDAKEHQCFEAYEELKKRLALYPMVRCLELFFDNLFEDLLFLGIKYACETQDMSYMIKGIY